MQANNLSCWGFKVIKKKKMHFIYIYVMGTYLHKNKHNITKINSTIMNYTTLWFYDLNLSKKVLIYLFR